MNRLFFFVAALLLMGSTGLAFAQDTPPAGSPAPTEGRSMRVRDPKVKLIMDRIKMQKDRIEAGVKDGKITADEAATLNAKLKAISEEMRADFKQNREAGQRGLNAEQIAQLNKELDANSTAIHDGSANAPATTPAP